jgi:hypothetical protein
MPNTAKRDMRDTQSHTSLAVAVRGVQPIKVLVRPRVRHPVELLLVVAQALVQADAQALPLIPGILVAEAVEGKLQPEPKATSTTVSKCYS